eukprot:TRINITY_DN4223_c0_g1_i2.p1 TRINITY_DN4223_c0_g1~~TRINITY_DN4223_c0_g1_i2.p1  ORF type:complete len:193 (+),score=95.14 TRINITY_DN4223_c0_g1_i2:267-845(+)
MDWAIVEEVVMVPKVNEMGQVPDENDKVGISVPEYDIGEWKKGIQQLVMGACISLFLVYKFEVVRPLFIQAISMPLTLAQNKLVRIYLFGQKVEDNEDLKRPFKVAGMFDSLKDSMKEMEGQLNEGNDKKKITNKGKKKPATAGGRKALLQRKKKGVEDVEDEEEEEADEEQDDNDVADDNDTKSADQKKED